MNEDYIYLIGNTNMGIVCKTYDKKIAKRMVKDRDGFKCLGIRATDEVEKMLCNVTDDIVFLITDHDTPIPLLVDEESELYSSIIEYAQELAQCILVMNDLFKYMKFDKAEKKLIKVASVYLIDFISLYITDTEISIEDSDILNINKITKDYLKRRWAI
jgi:hypothetical protein